VRARDGVRDGEVVRERKRNGDEGSGEIINVWCICTDGEGAYMYGWRGDVYMYGWRGGVWFIRTDGKETSVYVRMERGLVYMYGWRGDSACSG
jgi:hypothetical protein